MTRSHRDPRGRRPGFPRRSINRWLALVPIAWAAPAVAEAPVSEVRDVHGFHALSIAGSGEVTARRGAREQVRVEALPDVLERIVTEVDDGVLKIYHKPGLRFWEREGPVRIDITYVVLDGMDLSGSARVTTDALAAESFTVEISGSARVDVEAIRAQALRVQVTGSGSLTSSGLEAERAEVTVSGSGHVTLAGSVDTEHVSVLGSGEVDNGALKSRDASALVSGSGRISLWVEDSLDAKIGGSGDIEYRGDPTVHRQISGSGELRRH
ncbi:MAG: head GIN domain-containing protein [Pseudomonadales bacterium]